MTRNRGGKESLQTLPFDVNEFENRSEENLNYEREVTWNKLSQDIADEHKASQQDNPGDIWKIEDILKLCYV